MIVKEIDVERIEEQLLVHWEADLVLYFSFKMLVLVQSNLRRMREK